jgi:hypothetical protein
MEREQQAKKTERKTWAIGLAGLLLAAVGLVGAYAIKSQRDEIIGLRAEVIGLGVDLADANERFRHAAGMASVAQGKLAAGIESSEYEKAALRNEIEAENRIALNMFKVELQSCHAHGRKTHEARDQCRNWLTFTQKRVELCRGNWNAEEFGRENLADVDRAGGEEGADGR